MQFLRRPPWRTVVPAILLLGLCVGVYALWSPGKVIRDGRHDLGKSGIWIQHGWLGDDGWFQRHGRDVTRFRNEARIGELAATLQSHHIRYVYPHLCPCDPDGVIPPVDRRQTERFLKQFGNFRVLPWVGGVLGSDCSPESPAWRRNFVTSILQLLRLYPSLAGVHVNIEPLPSGNEHFLVLLRELRAALPSGKILSVAGYPPPTRWHPFPEVHWEEAYYRQVAAEADQLAVMMYDTSIRWPKVYQSVMCSWTSQVLDWGSPAEILLGLPTYEDAGTGYHHPHVENLENALQGVHAGLTGRSPLPRSYAGVAIYSEWQTDAEEWRYLKEELLKRP